MEKAKNYKVCCICGNSFPCPPSDKTVTCSKACSSIHRANTHRGKSNTWSEESKKRLSEKGQADNLKLGAAVGVKTWHLVSPGKKHYRFDNLSQWAKENYTLFGFDSPNDAEKVRNGLSAAKRKEITYKDWTVLDD